MKRLAALLLPLACFGFVDQPWFGDIYEFHLLAGYTYYRFNHVEGAVKQSSSPFNNSVLFGNLDLTFAPQWSLDIDLELADTTKQPFGFRDAGLQLRYLWLDDIVGDPLTVVTFARSRGVSGESLRDVGDPYHAPFEVEAGLALGKEIDHLRNWRMRIWGSGLVGLGNRGSPWVSAIGGLEGNVRDQHKWGIFCDYSHGYGKHQKIVIDDFDGYGKVRYKWVDLRFRYGYRIDVWGTLRVEYARRIVAELAPSNVNFFTLSYLLPFSF